MQELSDKIGNHQHARIHVLCMDCGKDFDICLERIGPDQIEIKAGAIGKRDGEYLFKCHGCFVNDQNFGLKTEIYSRVVGFLTPTNRWNAGKQEEYKMRKVFEPFPVEDRDEVFD